MYYVCLMCICVHVYMHILFVYSYLFSSWSQSASLEKYTIGQKFEYTFCVRNVLQITVITNFKILFNDDVY